MNVDLLHHARSLIKRRDGPEGVWPRAAAFLARQVLEEALDRRWAATHAGVERASRATQLACLGLLLTDAGLVSDARSVWASLSRACHHHHYELGPTAGQLELWIRQTARLVDALERTPTLPEA